VAAAATREPDLFLWDRNVAAAPEVVRPWVPEIVTPVRTSTATATGNPTVRNARELPICRMDDHSTHADLRHPLGKKA
jgi:hypothetical protein